MPITARGITTPIAAFAPVDRPPSLAVGPADCVPCVPPVDPRLVCGVASAETEDAIDGAPAEGRQGELVLSVDEVVFFAFEDWEFPDELESDGLDCDELESDKLELVAHVCFGGDVEVEEGVDTAQLNVSYCQNAVS